MAKWAFHQEADSGAAVESANGDLNLATERQRKGKNIKLSAGRKMVAEIMHHARQVPSLPVRKSMSLEDLVEARHDAGPLAPSWTALFMKAYGLAGLKHPELRRAWIAYPLPRLYEHPQTECGVMIERMHRCDNIVLGAKIRGPEHKSLTKIDRKLYEFKNAPVEKIRFFRQWLRVGGWPLPARRFAMWHTLHFSGLLRTKRMGTCVVSSLGSLGVDQLHTLAPLTTYLSFGAIGDDGVTDVHLVYDHRVMDGRTAARCLNTLETVLVRDMVRELHESCGSSSARFAA